MSCPKTQYLLQEYFSDELAPLTREELDRHLETCEFCNLELESLLFTQSNLQQWQDQRVPHWDRGLALFRQDHRAPKPNAGFWSPWQWIPTAASFAMLCLLLLNVNVVANEAGFSLAFGSQSSTQEVTQELQAQLDSLQASQRDEMQQLVIRMETRQDSNNIRLLQAVMDQSQRITTENFETMYTYFEDQRLTDLQDMRSAYQQLVDSDYETIRSLQQLVNYVGYADVVR
jgi:hypothetical protein